MTHDIKATVDYIEQLRIEDDDDAFPLALLKEWPSLLAELHRLWAVEEAAKQGRVTVDLNKLPHRNDLRADKGGKAKP